MIPILLAILQKSAEAGEKLICFSQCLGIIFLYFSNLNFHAVGILNSRWCNLKNSTIALGLEYFSVEQAHFVRNLGTGYTWLTTVQKFVN